MSREGQEQSSGGEINRSLSPSPPRGERGEGGKRLAAISRNPPDRASELASGAGPTLFFKSMEGGAHFLLLLLLLLLFSSSSLLYGSFIEGNCPPILYSAPQLAAPTVWLDWPLVVRAAGRPGASRLGLFLHLLLPSFLPPSPATFLLHEGRECIMAWRERE